MGTSKKISGKVMGYVILIGLVVLSWLIFKILSPHNFGSFPYAQLLSGEPDCYRRCSWFPFCNGNGNVRLLNRCKHYAFSNRWMCICNQI